MRAPFALSLVLLGCVHAGPKVASPRGPGSAGVTHHELADLLDRHWESTMAFSPEWATDLGDHRYDALVSDPSPAAAARRATELQGFLDASLAIDARRMSAQDLKFKKLFEQSLRGDLQSRVCQSETWALTPRSNPMNGLFSTLEVQPLRDDNDATTFVARIEAFSASLGVQLAALRAGRDAGRVANRTSVLKVVEAIRLQTAQPAAQWPILDRDLQGPGETALRARLTGVIDGALRPALTAFADGVERDILPAARGDDHPGLASLPDGAACYRARILEETTLPLQPAELHQRGLDAIAAVHREMVVLGASVFGVWDRGLLFERLRDDPALRFTDADAIVAKATEALRRAEAALPRALGKVPTTPCIVSVIPAYEAPFTSIAYYRQPTPATDGSPGKPGEYYVNTYMPETRPTFEAEALAFHESVPGHHTQISLSYEQQEVPAFLRYKGSTAFVEGWGLYAERLADELGLYSSDLDRLGMLSFDAWRSARLVVDTGVHELGWSRDEAIAWMVENTPLARNNIENEVDRYISWPGQAVAYKTGQLELLALRAQAEERLGERFDRKAFHDVVLRDGAVSLDALRETVEAWIAGQ